MFAVIFQLLLILIVLCLSVLYIFVQRNYEYWKKRGIRFEKPGTVFENLFDFERKNMWAYMYNLMKKHKTDCVGIFLGWKPALVINSKEFAERILVRDSDAFQLRYKSPDPNKGGEMTLFTVKNLKWKEMKQEMELILMKKHYKAFMKLMNIYATLLVQKIQRDHIDNHQLVNLKELFSLYPSNSVYYTIFGLRLFMLKHLMESFSSFACKKCQWNSWKIFKFTKILFSITLSKIARLKSVLTGFDRRGEKIAQEFLALCSLIQENKHLFAGDNTPDLLLQIRGAAVMVKAIQTSSTTLCYCVHELAYHPDKQEKLFKEIEHALGDRHAYSLGYNDFSELSYLSACIKETLRKYPTLAFLDRMCNKPYKMTDGVMIEPGTPVFVNVLAIQYNEDYYSEPNDWYPERFMIEAENDSHDFTFLPFGEGPRSCSGKDYGLMRIRTALAHMVLTFRFEPGEGYIVETDPDNEVLSPKSGGKVKFIPR